MIRRLAPSVALVVLIAPLTALAQSHVYLDQEFKASSDSVKKILFIAPDVSISEVSAGGVVEKVPDWSKQGRDYAAASLHKIAAGAKLEMIDVPTLTAAEQNTLNEHTALYQAVGVNVLNNGLAGGQIWTQRLASGITDYTIGPGLAFLAEKSGADAALFTVIEDYVSTPERKIMMAAGLLFGVFVPLGHTFAVSALVDLKTGRLLWQSYDTSSTPDMRVAADVNRVISDLFASFPHNAKTAANP